MYIKSVIYKMGNSLGDFKSEVTGLETSNLEEVFENFTFFQLYLKLFYVD